MKYRRSGQVFAGAPGELNMPLLSFDVDGMTTGGCAFVIQRALGKLDGISQSGVTLRPAVATVVTDPNRITPAQIELAISRLGYVVKARSKGHDQTASL